MSQCETRRIAVIDGNSLMHRAFHAVPDTMNAPDGTPTNAAFGFLSMFLKFLETAEPDGVVCAFDAGKPAIRMQALEQYKAQRPPMDDNLRVQFPVIEELLESMNVPVVKLTGWEGDDILGTMAHLCEERGWDAILVTGDKDAYQLVTDRVRVMTTKKGITDVVEYGPEEVTEKYGIGPDQFIDFLGLMGDTADNIPGVPGIGPKTASKLLSKYGTIEGIYEHIDELKGKQKENLVNNKDSAFLSRDVATIICDLDLDVNLDEVAFPSFDVDTVKEAFNKVGFRSHLAKVLSFAQGSASSEALTVDGKAIRHGSAGLAALHEAAKAGTEVAVAWKAPDQSSIFGDEVCMAFDTGEDVVYLSNDEALGALTELVSQGSFVAWDAKECLHQVYPADTAKEALITDDQLFAARFFDVQVAGYVLASHESSQLADLCERHLGIPFPQIEDEELALATQARCVRLLAGELRDALKADDALSVYESFDAPLVPVLASMERIGAAIDVDQLVAIGSETVEQIREIQSKIYEAAGEEFNIDSPKQVGHVLFEVLGLPPKKKTSRGYSTDAGVLQELASEHEVPGLILKYRELAKMNSTYIEALPRLRQDDGRVHTHFNMAVTTTGRLSSSEPNLQNIPGRTEFGRQVRSCFVPLAPGEVFVSADYSQIELRILAHLSDDPGLIEAFNSGYDFHAHTAATVFGVGLDEVTKEQRSRAKAVNFGIVYGQQAFGLAQTLKIPFGEAKDMIDRYFQVYPQVRSYLDEVVAQAQKTGYATTMFGRKRHIPELGSRNAHTRSFGERTAMNHPMQGTAADIIKLAMAQVSARVREEGLHASLILQVHDELDFSCPEEEADALSALVEEVMSGVVSLKVPLVVDVSHGVNWATAH